MDVNNMVAALAAKTVDAMVNVEPYNAIAVADGIGSDLIDFSGVDPMPVFMAATPDFVQQKPDTVVAYLKAWLDVAQDFKNNPNKVADVIYSFYTSKGYKMSLDDLRQGAVARRGQSRLSRRSQALPAGTGRNPAARRRRSTPSRTGRRRCGPISWKGARPDCDGSVSDSRMPAGLPPRRSATCCRHRMQVKGCAPSRARRRQSEA